MHTISLLRAGKLAGIKRLDLACDLTEFPDEIYQLSDSLEILNLSNNALSSLPDDLPKLTKLRIIFCSDNQFTELPEVLGRCQHLEMIGFKANKISNVPAASLPKKLRWLILTNNKITQLPETLGHCNQLQKLMLAGNRLQALPASMSACLKLELLRVSANCFTILPQWLLSLPRLAWLAYAGNPVHDANKPALSTTETIPTIDWENLAIQETLGEGASGIIYHAVHESSAGNTSVAVKLFKGDVTSDGLPDSERNAYIAAGVHANLIPVSADLMGHPNQQSGLVMALISPSFSNLASPPSLTSCTRDCYVEETHFTIFSTLNIALGITSALQHLHAKGIMHGDLYAHNILWNQGNDCLLCDFCAASFTPQHNTEVAHNLERLEVRAFSCLLEELLARCHYHPEYQYMMNALVELQQRCAHPTVISRPLFSEIQYTLNTLALKINA